MKLTLAAFWTLVIISSAASTSTDKCFSDEDPSKSGATVEALSDGSTDFAFQLFKNVVSSQSDPKSNVFISPISIWSVLTLAYLGARENTKKELETGLGLSKVNQGDVLDLYHRLQDELLHNATEASNYTFNMANKLFLNQDLQLKDCISQHLSEEIEKIDFSKSPEEARVSINKWVEDLTNNKIKDLIPSGNIDAQTIMVIVNAAYLKAIWQNIFLTSATAEEEFFVEPALGKNTKMMHETSHFPYLANDSDLGCSCIELPYSGNKMSMLILLPTTTVQDLITKLNKDNLNKILAKLASTKVSLTMPKFKIEQSMELTKTMRALGINDLFDAIKADLSGFTGSKNAYASFIHHKTFIEVNEGGTEAAAATALGIAPASLPLPSAPPIEFKVDRPFVIMILNKKLNSISFMGVISDPTILS